MGEFDFSCVDGVVQGCFDLISHFNFIFQPCLVCVSSGGSDSWWTCRKCKAILWHSGIWTTSSYWTFYSDEQQTNDCFSISWVVQQPSLILLIVTTISKRYAAWTLRQRKALVNIIIIILSEILGTIMTFYVCSGSRHVAYVIYFSSQCFLLIYDRFFFFIPQPLFVIGF